MRSSVGVALAGALLSLTAGACSKAMHGATADFDGDHTVRTIVTASAIERSGAQTVWDALERNIPFYVFHSNGRIEHRGRSSIYLSDQPLVVLDGVTLTDPTVLLNMPAADVWLIEVLDGVDATTFYGTNAGAGTIRIFTRTS